MQRILFFLICLFFLHAAEAQSFYLQAASTSLNIDESMEIQITSENFQSDNIVFPEFKDFKVVAGPTKSEEYSIVNGVYSENYYWTIYVIPKHTGVCTVEKATLLTTKGKVYTKEVEVKVVASKNIISNTTIIASTVKANDHYILKVIPEKNTVYVGEEFIVTYKLYINEAIEGGQIVKDIANSNFCLLKMFNNKSDQVVQKEMLGGKMYTSVVVQKSLFTCTKAGRQDIGSVKFNVSVKQKPKSLIEELLGMQNEDILVQSDPVSIQVKVLPDPKPILFDQSIGQYKIEGHLNKSTANTNEPLIYSCKISGMGNLRNSLAPILQLPSCFEQYDAQKKEVFNFVNYKTSSEINYDYMFLPHEPGTYKITPPHLVYFDPITATYITLEQDSFEVQVTGKATPYINQNSTLKKDTLALSINKTIGEIYHSNEYELYENIWLPIAVSPILLLIFFTAYTYRKKGKVTSLNKQLSSTIIEEKLKDLSDLTDSKELYKQAETILLDILVAKFPKGSFSSLVEIRNTLTINHIDNVLVNKIIAFLEENQIKMYAPYTIDSDSNEVINTLKIIISTLHETLH